MPSDPSEDGLQELNLDGPAPDLGARRQQIRQMVDQRAAGEFRQAHPFAPSLEQPPPVPERRYRQAEASVLEQDQADAMAQRAQEVARRRQEATETEAFNSQAKAQYDGSGQLSYIDPLTKRLVPVLEPGTNRPLFKVGDKTVGQDRQGLPAIIQRDKYGQQQYRRPTLKASEDPMEGMLYADLPDGQSVPYMSVDDALKHPDIQVRRQGMVADAARQRAQKRQNTESWEEALVPVRTRFNDAKQAKEDAESKRADLVDEIASLSSSKSRADEMAGAVDKSWGGFVSTPTPGAVAASKIGDKIQARLNQATDEMTAIDTNLKKGGQLYNEFQRADAEHKFWESKAKSEAYAKYESILLERLKNGANPKDQKTLESVQKAKSTWDAALDEAANHEAFQQPTAEASPFTAAAQSAVSGIGAIAKGAEQAAYRMPPVADELGRVDPDMLAEYQRRTAQPAAKQMEDIQKGSAYQWGSAVQDAAKELYATSPESDKRFLTKLGHSVGGFLPLVASGPVAPVTMGLQATGDEMERIYADRVAKGATPEVAADFAMKRALASGTAQAALFEILPKPLQKAGSKIIDRLSKGVLSRFLAGRLAQGAEGAMLGGASAATSNVAADRPTLEGTGEGAEGLAVAQMLLPRGGGGVERQPPPAPESGEPAPTEPTPVAPTSEQLSAAKRTPITGDNFDQRTAAIDQLSPEDQTAKLAEMETESSVIPTEPPLSRIPAPPTEIKSAQDSAIAFGASDPANRIPPQRSAQEAAQPFIEQEYREAAYRDNPVWADPERYSAELRQKIDESNEAWNARVRDLEVEARRAGQADAFEAAFAEQERQLRSPQGATDLGEHLGREGESNAELMAQRRADIDRRRQEQTTRAQGVESALSEQEREMRSPQGSDILRERLAAEGESNAELLAQQRASSASDQAARAQRAEGMETGLAEQERIRQSQRGGELLREDLRGGEPPPAATPVEPVPIGPRDQSVSTARPSYGEKYIAKLGIEGAMNRVDHLRRRLQEESDNRNERAAENLAQEADNITHAIQAKEPRYDWATNTIPVDIGPRDNSISTGTGVPTAKEEAMLKEQRRLVEEHLKGENPATPTGIAEQKAKTWADTYFKNRGHTPTANQYRQIYDQALGRFLKETTTEEPPHAPSPRQQSENNQGQLPRAEERSAVPENEKEVRAEKGAEPDDGNRAGGGEGAGVVREVGRNFGVISDAPLAQRYLAAKRDAPDKTILVRLGDFYEAFGDDAKAIAKAGKITLTKRAEMPMAGVPVHGLDPILKTLRDAGLDVETIDGATGKPDGRSAEVRQAEEPSMAAAKLPKSPKPAGTVAEKSDVRATSDTPPAQMKPGGGKGDTLIARSKPKLRADVDNGTRYSEWRIRKVTAEDYEKLSEGQRSRGDANVGDFKVERRIIKTEEGGPTETGEWETSSYGKTKKEAVEDEQDQGYMDADSLDPAHEKAVQDSRARVEELRRIEANKSADLKAEDELREKYIQEVRATPLKGTSKEIDIAFNDADGNPSTRKESAMVYGNWAITKKGEGKRAEYVVTHVPTGLKVQSKPTVGQAKEVIQAFIHSGLDVASKDLVSDRDTVAKLAQAARALNGGTAPEWFKGGSEAAEKASPAQMSAKARIAELEGAGVSTINGKPLKDANAAEIINAVGKLRRGQLEEEAAPTKKRSRKESAWELGGALDPTSPAALRFEHDSGIDKATLDRIGEAESILRAEGKGTGNRDITLTPKRIASDESLVGGSPDARLHGAGAKIARSLGAIFGKRIQFVEPSRSQEWAAFALPGRPDTVVVNTSSRAPLISLTGHEFTHTLSYERPDLYAALEKLVREQSPMPAEYAESKQGIYPKPEREWIADQVGQRFDEPEFWESVGKQAKKDGKLSEFASWAMDWFSKLTARAKNVLSAEVHDAVVKDLNALRDGIAGVFTKYAEDGKERRGNLGEASDVELSQPSQSLSDRAIAALQKAKIGKPGRILSADPFTVAYDAAIDFAILAIRAGRAVGDVVKMATARFMAKHPKATPEEIARVTADINRAVKGPAKAAAPEAARVAPESTKTSVTPKQETRSLLGNSEALDEIQRIFAPQTRGEGARTAAGAMREHGAELAQRTDRANEYLSDASKTLGNMPVEDRWKFVDSVESGAKQSNPELQPLADKMRTILDDRRKQVQDLGTGALDNFIEDYFPHIWKNPDKALTAFQEAATKKPLEGSKSFLKQRTIPTTAEGRALGLEPVSSNPVDLVLLKLREMDKFITARRTLAELKDKGMVELVKAGETPPIGYKKIEDRIATVYGRIMGEYYAPENVAQVINNYLSPGLRNSKLFRNYLGLANVVNSFQLGLSAFHLGFTSLDASTSKLAAGIEDAAAGKMGQAAKSIAGTPLAPITNALAGDKVLKEWTKPGSQGAEIAQIVDGLKAAGGRAKMDSFYQTQITKRMMDNFRDGSIWGKMKGLGGLPFAGLEQAARPIMEYIVPRQKLGVFADLARREMDKLGPDASRDEVRKAMGKAWDSVDNRLGQMVYDNLFWKKAAKDLSMASVRSLGWNLGTLRELGGGGADTIKFWKDVATKKNPEFTHRMAYMIAMPALAGLIGATTQYALTGKGPDELRDYFFPKTGEKDQQGRDIRISLPSYMKDVYHYGHAPVDTMLAKIHPAIALIRDMLTNKDYFDRPIRNEDDPFVKQAADVASHIAQQFAPIGVTQAIQAAQTDQKGGEVAANLAGVTRAPKWLSMSKAEQLAEKLNSAHLGSASVPTTGGQYLYEKKRDILGRLRNGTPAEKSAAETEIRLMVSRDEIPQATGQAMIRGSKQAYLLNQLTHLDANEAVRVFRAAEPAERNQIGQLVSHKIQRSRLLSEDKMALMKEFSRLQSPLATAAK